MSALKVTVIVVTICALLTCGQLIEADESKLGDYYLLHDACASVLNEQISWELYATIVYMNMAGYFDRPTVARLGYAKFFKDQSLEEYGHASKFIDYINQRNGTVKSINIAESPKNEWLSPKEALHDAIKLEKHVFAKLRHIHDIADQQCQDPHLTDFLESYFFTEQVESIQELQIMATKLENSCDIGGSSVVEYLEDKVYLKGKDKKD